MVGYNIYGHIVVMEIILAWLWLIGIAASLVLVGSLLQGPRNKQFLRGSYYVEARLLPKHMELFQQRRRKRHIIFKRLSRLSLTPFIHLSVCLATLERGLYNYKYWLGIIQGFSKLLCLGSGQECSGQELF